MTKGTQRDASDNPKSEPRLWMLAEAVRFEKVVNSKCCARKWSALERPRNGLSGSELLVAYMGDQKLVECNQSMDAAKEPPVGLRPSYSPHNIVLSFFSWIKL